MTLHRLFSGVLSRARAGARLRLASQESGIAAVEFSLILPILLVLWIGGVEVTSALSVDRRLNNLASAMGDLVARNKEVTYDDIEDLFDLADAALFPYSASGIAMRITAVDMNGAGTANVGWTRKQGTLPGGVANFADGAQVNSFVPSDLRVPNSQIIMAEVYHTYTPAVGYVITGNVQLDDKMFFVPRLVNYIALCEDDDDDDCET